MGLVPYRTLCRSRFWYAVGVTSNSPRLNVGSTVTMEKLDGVQNLTRSSSCLSRARTNAGSGDGLVSQIFHCDLLTLLAASL